MSWDLNKGSIPYIIIILYYYIIIIKSIKFKVIKVCFQAILNSLKTAIICNCAFNSGAYLLLQNSLNFAQVHKLDGCSYWEWE